MLLEVIKPARHTKKNTIRRPCICYTASVMYDFFKFAVLLVCLPLASHSLSAQTIAPTPNQGVLQEYGDEAAVVVRDLHHLCFPFAV
jgi:hypothetical protein